MPPAAPPPRGDRLRVSQISPRVTGLCPHGGGLGPQEKPTPPPASPPPARVLPSALLACAGPRVTVTVLSPAQLSSTVGSPAGLSGGQGSPALLPTVSGRGVSRMRGQGDTGRLESWDQGPRE